MNLKKMTCRALIVSMLALSFQTASAGLIGADQAAPGTAPADRAAVLEVLARADTASQLQAMGVDPLQARERVAAMNDQEVAQLAADIRQAPAGADGGTVLAVIVIAAAIWYFAYRR
ncbi:PA2779 family protein [Ramlibacter tataouinensis]|uniref:PA2779 family protein n=1 Tax=Ramlibacter tataouinensis TaxID=94132 RepID=UPI0022F3C491|nr:PA2779 family protein [Ramlibacter tataouinensis]WBY00969.1 PA2779 family protein [Ramlibacter tataouinensis]